MKNLIVSKANTGISNISTSEDMLSLVDGEVGLLFSNGSTSISDKTFSFVQGKPAGSSPKVGLALNPKNFKFTVKEGLEADSKVVSLGYHSSAATTGNLTTVNLANYIGSSIGVRIVLMNFPKTVYANNNFEFVETQVKSGDTLATIQTRLKAKLDTLAVKIGNGFEVTSTNSTTYYGFSFTANPGFNFTIIGSGLAELSPVNVVTAVVFGEGDGIKMADLEKEFAVRLGYNPNVKINEQVYTEGWDIDPTKVYDVIIITSKMDAQYSILGADNDGLLVSQWIAIPTDGHEETGAAALLIAILNQIKAEYQGTPVSTVGAMITTATEALA